MMRLSLQSKSSLRQAASPNLHAHGARFVRSIKEEAQHHMAMLGDATLSYTIHQSLAHYHAERHHQGLGINSWHRSRAL